MKRSSPLTLLVTSLSVALGPLALGWSLVAARPLAAADAAPPRPGDALLADYFRRETAKLREACLSEIRTKEDWLGRRDEYRRQLFEMLGLEPRPERTDLKATVTSQAEQDGVIVEQVHFQSRPGLYVTGNLYRPKDTSQRYPAILYVCGHGGVKKNGVSYGNKVHYQHHGGWFARHGYVCLTIDSLQLGEIEATHHGTHNLGMWWWLSRGYTPAGVEAWNCIRALDYLQSRAEVDGERLGVTGRSGGGAYSWWIAALDERIRAAVPVAGITDLQDHVVNGCVEGHCDCMYFVNTYRWDYGLLAALVAPRPLLISNTDRDGIFPLHGVVRTYDHARRIYELFGAGEKLALNITAGGHKDTQELQTHAFRWFDQHLRNDQRLLEKPAVPLFEQDQLRVFQNLPTDQLNTRIHDTFVPMADVKLPGDAAEWQRQRESWLQQLQEKCFRAWPTSQETPPLNLKEAFSSEQQGVVLRAYDFDSQEPFRLRLYVAHRAGLEKADLVVLNTLDSNAWNEFLGTYSPAFSEALSNESKSAGSAAEARPTDFESTRKMFASFPWVMAYVAPRGVGLTAWDPTPRKQTHIRRRFYLLGQTLEGMQAYDVRRALQATRTLPKLADTPVWLQSQREMAAISLYAALFEPPVKRLDLHQLPKSHREGPALLNVQRIFDLPQAVALAADRSQVVLYQDDESGWDYPRTVLTTLKRDAKSFQVRKEPQPSK